MTVDPGRELAVRAAGVHDALTAWLRATYPDEESLVILTACSYEIGRLAGQLTVGMSDRDLDATLDAVRATMRQQVVAYRRGLTV